MRVGALCSRYLRLFMKRIGRSVSGDLRMIENGAFIVISECALGLCVEVFAFVDGMHWAQCVG